ncbi:LacI family DNA-binding transcriptional regulator [Phytohabitans rumicis]|uniref:Transcriptional regulator n=1 Tax=Phytohabitans rumicis TaxID=1076125 RepID=A0A6V8KV75_9ACTN|nr:substrate-binding domain-containing protein [Phytohabitans rumicis]GFJ86628.1 transcriptional regulator [Phytohabitans rumicis]
MAVIARLAGVSTPTVSRVLNGRSGVASETRRQVEALLQEHGYRRPNVAVPAASVEVVFFGLESHLGISILRGVERVVRQRDLVVGFTDVSMPGSKSRTWADQLLARRPVGVIAAHSYFTPQDHALLSASGIPMVALDPAGIPPEAVPSVGAANWSGGVAAARHLLLLGHRRIAVIGGPVNSLAARARLEACRAAMDAAGVPLEGRLVRNGEFFFEEGLALGRDLLGLADRPTAVVCGNDLQALGVYEAARLARLSIPDDLSVIGFDDLDCSHWCGPPLTTVRQPFDEMGAAAAALVLAFVDGEVPSQTRVELPTTLMVRGSTAPPRDR